MNRQREHRVFGKHRAIVASNADPLKLGRLQVRLPQFEGMKEAWCLPNTPYAGKGVGFFTVPPVGAHVWVEFEGGNLDVPIWSGCFWAQEETPLFETITPAKKVLKTDTILMVLDDTKEETAGGFTLDVSKDAAAQRMTLVCDKNGIVLTTYGSDDKAVSTVKLTPTQIVVDHPQATITLEDQQITLTVPQAKTTMTAEQVKTELESASTTVTSESVTSAVGSVSAEVTTSAVTLTSGPSTAQVAPAGCSLKNGANSVMVSPASVALNDPALVVI